MFSKLMKTLGTSFKRKTLTNIYLNADSTNGKQRRDVLMSGRDLRQLLLLLIAQDALDAV